MDTREAPPKHVDVTVATHNLGDRPERTIIRTLFAGGATIVGLQEMADQPRDKFRLPDWVDAYWPAHPPGDPGPSQNVDENPILWDARVWHAVRSGSKFLTGNVNVGAEGAGPNVMNIKWLNWVHLRHRVLDEVVSVGNVHCVPSILANDKRGDLMRAQVEGMVEWADRRRDRRITMLLGDFNADPTRDRERPFLRPLFDEARFRDCWRVTGHDGGSMHERKIDLVLLREHERAKIVDMDVPRHLGFDHKPVLATVRVQRRS